MHNIEFFIKFYIKWNFILKLSSTYSTQAIGLQPKSAPNQIELLRSNSSSFYRYSISVLGNMFKSTRFHVYLQTDLIPTMHTPKNNIIIYRISKNIWIIIVWRRQETLLKCYFYNN